MKYIDYDFLFFAIIILHFLVIFVDNKSFSVLVLESRVPNLKIRSWNKRERIGTFRGIGLLIPPILGYYLALGLIQNIKLAYFVASLISLFLTLIQFYNLNKKIYNEDVNDFRINFKITFLIILGSIGFFFLYHVHFLTNILAYHFNEHALWLVQITPFLSAISTFYVIFIIDKKIAKNLDYGNIKYKNILQIMIVRTFGRFINLLVSILMII
jgi:hypothetical protein